MAQNINVDVTPNLFQPTLYYHQGDIGRAFTITISTKDGYTIPSGATVKIEATKPSGLGFSVSGTLSGNVVSFVSTEGMTDEYGRFPAQLKITSGNDILYTANFLMVGAINTHPASVTDGTAEQVISEITLLVERAETAASTAATDAANAAQARVDEMMDYLPSEVADLKSDISQISEETGENLVNQADLLNIEDATYSGGWYSFNANKAYIMYGGEDAQPSFPHRTIKANTQYTLSFKGKYDGSASSGFAIGFKFSDGTLQQVTAGDGSEKTYTLTSTSGKTISKIYFDWNNNVESYVKDMMLVEGATAPASFIPYDAKTAHDAVARASTVSLENEINAVDDSFKSLAYRKMNLFDKTNVTNAWINSSTGGYNPDSSYRASDYIYIKDISKLESARMFSTAFYDENKEYITNTSPTNSGSTALLLDVPSNAYYMRVSCAATWLDVAKIGESDITMSGEMPYSLFTFDNLVDDTHVIVSKSGNSAYTSLLEALFTTDKDIIVRDGEFDIVAEYKAKFGDSFFDSEFDRTVAGDFALGLYVDNRKVIFGAGTSVSFDLTGIDVSNVGGDDRRFSLLWLGLNAEIYGLKAVTYNNWYAIHDDVAEADLQTPFTNKIVDCVIDSYNTVNVNVIGGGCGDYSVTVIDNCYLDNHVNDTTTRTLRYHNTWHPYAEPIIRVSRTYVNGRMYFGYYGLSTKMGTVNVNNCSMANTIELLPVTADSVENLRLIQYANEIRN